VNIQLTNLDRRHLLTLLQELAQDTDLTAAMECVRQHIPPGKKEVLPYQAAALYLLASQVPCPGSILEIGTSRGFTATTMALAAPWAMVTTLEIDPEKARVAQRAMAELFNVCVIHRASTVYMNRITAPEDRHGYDLIFVDGDHKNVKADLPWFNRLNIGGLILFHDYSPADSPHACPPVYDALNEFALTLGRPFDVHIVDDKRAGMVGWYRKEGETV